MLKKRVWLAYILIFLYYLDCCKAEIILLLNGIHIHRDNHDSHHGGSRGSHRDGSRDSRHGGNRGIHGDHSRGVRNREHRPVLRWLLECKGKLVLRSSKHWLLLEMDNGYDLPSAKTATAQRRARRKTAFMILRWNKKWNLGWPMTTNINLWHPLIIIAGTYRLFELA